jgi:hypothetical protein
VPRDVRARRVFAANIASEGRLMSLDSLNPCSISFSDQIPMEGRANKCRGAFCDGCDRPGLVGISRRDRGPIALGLYTAEGWAPAREGGSDRLRAADHDRGVPRQESRFRLRARDAGAGRAVRKVDQRVRSGCNARGRFKMLIGDMIPASLAWRCSR